MANDFSRGRTQRNREHWHLVTRRARVGTVTPARIVAATALASCLLTSRVAAAQSTTTTGTDSHAMTAAMHHYFAGEKREGIFFFSAGVVAGAASGVLFGLNTEFSRGMAWPLAIIGVIQLGVGAVVYLRTDAQVAGLDRDLTTQPAAYRGRELPRMTTVNFQFRLLEVIESTLLLGGVAMTVAGFGSQQETLKGVGIGLAIQSAAMLTLDVLAHRRGTEYADSLRHFQLSVVPANNGTSVLGSFAMRF
jgi:hypothetical protein